MNPRLDDAIAREAAALAAAATPIDEGAEQLTVMASGSAYLLRAAREEVLDRLQDTDDNVLLLVGAVRLLNAALDGVRDAD